MASLSVRSGKLPIGCTGGTVLIVSTFLLLPLSSAFSTSLLDPPCPNASTPASFACFPRFALLLPFPDFSAASLSDPGEGEFALVGCSAKQSGLEFFKDMLSIVGVGGSAVEKPFGVVDNAVFGATCDAACERCWDFNAAAAAALALAVAVAVAKAPALVERPGLARGVEE